MYNSLVLFRVIYKRTNEIYLDFSRFNEIFSKIAESKIATCDSHTTNSWWPNSVVCLVF